MGSYKQHKIFLDLGLCLSGCVFVKYVCDLGFKPKPPSKIINKIKISHTTKDILNQNVTIKLLYLLIPETVLTLTTKLVRDVMTEA